MYNSFSQWDAIVIFYCFLFPSVTLYINCKTSNHIIISWQLYIDIRSTNHVWTESQTWSWCSSLQCNFLYICHWQSKLQERGNFGLKYLIDPNGTNFAAEIFETVQLLDTGTALLLQKCHILFSHILSRSFFMKLIFIENFYTFCKFYS